MEISRFVFEISGFLGRTSVLPSRPSYSLSLVPGDPIQGPYRAPGTLTRVFFVESHKFRGKARRRTILSEISSPGSIFFALQIPIRSTMLSALCRHIPLLCLHPSVVAHSYS